MTKQRGLSTLNRQVIYLCGVTEAQMQLSKFPSAEMWGTALQRDSDVPPTSPSHISLAVVTHSDGENTVPSICTSLKQESHIPASLLNGGYKSQLSLLAQGLPRLLITSTESYCSALDEYQLERRGNLRNGEERAVGDWLCCFGEGLPKKYYLGRQFFAPTLRGGW